MADDSVADGTVRAVDTDLLDRAALDAPAGGSHYADRVLRAARLSRRRRAGVVLAAVVVVLALGVPALVTALVRNDARTGSAASRHTSSPAVAADPTAAIYAAAVRYVLGTEPSAAGPRTVAIYDHTCAVAMNLGGACPREAIPSAVQAEISARLAESFTVTWLPEARSGPAPMPTVTLGPVSRQAQTVQVPITMSCGGLCGRGLTAVLTANSVGTWTVTGTIGVEWIS
jgi:hypothetical protein